MQPKCILIKSLSKTFIDLLNNELELIPSIRFFSWKTNGMYTTVIKCYNYYKNLSQNSSKNFYGSYIFLYTNLSILLSEIIIKCFESVLLKRILKLQYFYFSKSDQNTILNISNMLLNGDMLLCDNNFNLQKKELIISELLSNFRKCNYLNIDGLVNFCLTNYNRFLEDIIINSTNIFLLDKNYMEILKFILQNLLY